MMISIVDTPAQFSISPETGLVTVDANNPLDYETNTTLSFTVEASDMASTPCTVSTNTFLNSELLYIILILDTFSGFCYYSTRCQ